MNNVVPSSGWYNQSKPASTDNTKAAKRQARFQAFSGVISYYFDKG